MRDACSADGRRWLRLMCGHLAAVSGLAYAGLGGDRDAGGDQCDRAAVQAVLAVLDGCTILESIRIDIRRSREHRTIRSRCLF